MTHKGSQDVVLDVLTEHMRKVYETLDRLIYYAETGIHPGKAFLKNARALIPDPTTTTKDT